MRPLRTFQIIINYILPVSGKKVNLLIYDAALPLIMAILRRKIPVLPQKTGTLRYVESPF